MLSAARDVPTVRDGEVTVGAAGQTQVLTNEDEAREISKSLLEKGTKFSMSRISLDDIFFHLVHGEDEEVHSQ